MADKVCLLFILQPKLVLARIGKWPLTSFVCQGRHYLEVGSGNWSIFYDWLRDADSNLLGVRYIGPFSDADALIAHIKNLDYVRVTPSRDLEIFFSEKRVSDPRLSGDQDFVYDAVFRSNDGEYAIGFGIDDMRQADLMGLERAPVGWVDARLL